MNTNALLDLLEKDARLSARDLADIGSLTVHTSQVEMSK